MRSIGLPELILIAIFVGLLIVRVTRYFCLGATAGGIVGFLLRPSVTLVGQLPFGVVLTQGRNLRGLDVLRGAAETSFNYLLAGVLIGGLGGLVLAVLVKTSSPASIPAPVTQAPVRPDSTVAGGQWSQPSLNRFCISCGAPLNEGATFCGACGAKKASA